MPTKSTNNIWRPSTGMNTGSFAQIGGQEPVGTRMQGQLGGIVVHSNASALLDSNTSIGTLYQGTYQLVKANSTLVRGQLVSWDTLANNGMNDFEVTSTLTANVSFRAGVAICAATSGEYVFIQTGGLASVLYGAGTPDTTLGLAVIQATNKDVPLQTVNTVNTSAATTAQLTEDLLAYIGLAYETPAADGVLRVWLSPGSFFPNINQ
jgi:hypothetical protein